MQENTKRIMQECKELRQRPLAFNTAASMGCPAVLTGRIAVLAGSAVAAQAKLLDNKAFQHAVSELQKPVALDAQQKPRLS